MWDALYDLFFDQPYFGEKTLRRQDAKTLRRSPGIETIAEGQVCVKEQDARIAKPLEREA
jgi:hypothetical protein